MPESAHFMKKNKNYSSASSCESSSEISEWEEDAEREDENVKKEKNVSFDLEDKKLIERSSKLNQYKWQVSVHFKKFFFCFKKWALLLVNFQLGMVFSSKI